MPVNSSRNWIKSNRRSSLDIHLTSSNDRHHLGSLSDWHAHLEEMQQQDQPRQKTNPNSVSTSDADGKPPQRPLTKPVTNNQATKSNASIHIHINIS
jgi:hypothetical protein